MNKDLVKKCLSIEHNLIDNNMIIEYSDLITELNKNHHYRTENQHNNAINFLVNRGIVITEKGKISKKNFSTLDINNINTIIENATDQDNIELDSIMDVAPSEKLNLYVLYIEQLGYVVTNEDEIDDINFSDFGYVVDSVKQYFMEIAQYPLLTFEEEKELFKEYKEHNNIDAKNKLIVHNLRLVVSMAKKWNKTQGKNIINILDLISYGNMGIIIAADRFDPSLGYKFSTYATWWIRQAIFRGLSNDSRTIRMPVHAIEQTLKNKQARIDLSKELGRDCTEEELVKYINDNKLFACSNIKSMTVPTLRLYDISYADNVVSWYTPINNGDDADDSYLGDFIPSEENTPEETLIDMDLKEAIHDVIDHVLQDARENKVIKLRFGIDDNKPKTLEQVASIFNVTRERIRQIETKALRRIRFNKYTKTRLDGYYNEDIFKYSMRGL